MSIKPRECRRLAESTNAGGVEMIQYLKQYKSELMAKDLVRQNQVPYMVGWVHRFLSLGEPEETVFADVLEKEGKEGWQIRQALEAVKLYCTKYTCRDKKEPVGSNLEPLDEMRNRLRTRHYAPSTEKSYLQWCSRYLRYCERHKLETDSDGAMRDYLTHLALKRKVASSTQNQAFNAILFLFRNVWGTEPSGINAVRARRSQRLPSVLTPEEVRKLLEAAGGVTGLILRLIYSSGIRLSEALRLRVQDLNLQNCSLTVRSGKGDKDRVTVLGRMLVPFLEKQKEVVCSILAASRVPVFLPGALERKYPGAGLELCWQYVFPGTGYFVDPSTGNVRRHHIHPSCVQKAVRRAVLESGINKRASVHTLRHCFATHMLMAGVDLCEIQELLGHKNLETTRIYLHVMKGMKKTVESPLDLLMAKEM